MASRNLLSLPFLLMWMINGVFAADPGNNSVPFMCSTIGKTCNFILYQFNGLTDGKITTLNAVNASQIKPITHGNKQNDFVTVPCSCRNVSGTLGYYYNTQYLVKPNDTFELVSSQLYSGQVWPVGNEERKWIEGNTTTIHLLCGCIETESQIMVTYTVQPHDTLPDIATLLSADISDIERSNSMLTQRPGYIDVGYILYVPMYKNGVPPAETKRGKSHKWTIIIGVLAAVTVLTISTLAILLMRRKRFREHNEEREDGGDS